MASKPSWSSIESGLVAAAIRRAPRGLFGSRWRRDVPTLCVNGSMDQFFGRRNSVSETVVKRASDSMLAKGDRPHITGDAALRMAELGMTRALVAQMEGAKHAMCATHDFALRELLADFLNDPVACASIPERWEEDDRKERMMLWHSVVTPGKCSFASVASTERAAGFSSGPPRPPGADSPIGEGDARRRGHARKISEVPPVRSFLDLTSAMAKLLVRGGVPGEPEQEPEQGRVGALPGRELGRRRERPRRCRVERRGVHAASRGRRTTERGGESVRRGNDGGGARGPPPRARPDPRGRREVRFRIHIRGGGRAPPRTPSRRRGGGGAPPPRTPRVAREAVSPRTTMIDDDRGPTSDACGPTQGLGPPRTIRYDPP